jgi:hypothetical protein
MRHLPRGELHRFPAVLHHPPAHEPARGAQGRARHLGYLTYLIYAGCLVHAGKDRQQPGQTGEGKKAEHQLLRGGQPQLTPRLPWMDQDPAAGRHGPQCAG